MLISVINILPEAMRTAIAQRDGYHVKWDTDKKETIEKFYKHYPQFTVWVSYRRIQLAMVLRHAANGR